MANGLKDEFAGKRIRLKHNGGTWIGLKTVSRSTSISSNCSLVLIQFSQIPHLVLTTFESICHVTLLNGGKEKEIRLIWAAQTGLKFYQLSQSMSRKLKTIVSNEFWVSIVRKQFDRLPKRALNPCETNLRGAFSSLISAEGGNSALCWMCLVIKLTRQPRLSLKSRP